MGALRFSTTLISGLLLAWIVSACQPMPSVVGNEETFGEKVAGSYLVEGTESGIPDSPDLHYKMLATFTADGSFTSELTIDFGADHPPRFKSGERGSWEQAGEREIAVTMLAFDYGQEEAHPAVGPQNTHVETVRMFGTAVFDEDFENYIEETVIEILAPDQDPLDPDAEPLFPAFQGERIGRRIPAKLDGSDPHATALANVTGDPTMRSLIPGDMIDEMTLSQGPLPFDLSIPPYVAFCNANPQLESDLTIAKPGTYTIECNMPPLPELMIGLGWITSDEEKRDEFWDVMETELYVNDQPVDQQAFGRLDAGVPMTGLPDAEPDETVTVPLRVWNVVLHDITAEKLTLRYVWHISHEAFDGFSTYPAGIYDLTYNITVDDSLVEAEGTPAPVAYVPQQPMEVFDAFNAAVNAHDVDAQLGFFDDNAIAQFPNQPPPKLHRGHDEIRAWLQIDADDNIHIDADDATISGDTVSAIAKVAVDSLPPDFILVGSVEVTVKDGKITSFSYTLSDDTLAELAALESE